MAKRAARPDKTGPRHGTRGMPGCAGPACRLSRCPRHGTTEA
uniref:Uncharacterized protein n=1 Tax=Arundo donax TaxID=35708 RepID=A0A0A9H988_ARUDO